MNLEVTLRERNEFHKSGLERIRDYYSLPENEREEKTSLKNPPHEIFMKRASVLIFSGLENLEKIQYLGDGPIGFIFIGVGTEILLKAIILKEDPNYFIKNINIEKQKTLSYQQCSNKLNEWFSTVPLSAIDWLFVILVSSSVFWIGEIIKLFRREDTEDKLAPQT